MRGPEWIPCPVSISDASWDQLGNELEEVILRHSLVFPDFKKGKEQALKFLVGQVMRSTKGRAKPDLVNDLLKEKLK